jgi:hypothetical protein
MDLALFVAGCVLCVLVVAILVHNFFEGETLIADCLDEFKLGRTDISAFDRIWRENPARSECVVTLTTIPSRLPHIANTLKSLMRQSRAPSRIVLNLPAFSKRENTPYVVPEFLRTLQAVQIVQCEDIGPATKVVPTLLRELPLQKIIVVDDDRIYPANLVADLESAADREATAAFGMSGWVVPEDLIDRPTTVISNLKMSPPSPVRARRLKKPMPVDILQGLSGYLIRPAFFDLADLANYEGAPSASYFVDDVWISGHCRAHKFAIPAARYNYQPKLRHALYLKTSLGLINRGVGGNEQRHNSLVLRFLADKWRVGGPRDKRPPT